MAGLDFGDGAAAVVREPTSATRPNYFNRYGNAMLDGSDQSHQKTEQH
jgi:hypothetical protein